MGRFGLSCKGGSHWRPKDREVASGESTNTDQGEESGRERGRTIFHPMTVDLLLT
jgi:hypothetical protein